jgi:hypothetical protein
MSARNSGPAIAHDVLRRREYATRAAVGITPCYAVPGFADPRQFRRCQISLSAFLRKMLDAPARVEADWHGVGLAAKEKGCSKPAVNGWLDRACGQRQPLQQIAI